MPLILDCGVAAKSTYCRKHCSTVFKVLDVLGSKKVSMGGNLCTSTSSDGLRDDNGVWPSHASNPTSSTEIPSEATPSGH